MWASTRRFLKLSGPSVSGTRRREPPRPTATRRSAARGGRSPCVSNQSRTAAARSVEKPTAPPQWPKNRAQVSLGHAREPSHSRPQHEFVWPSRRMHMPGCRRTVPASSDSIGKDSGLTSARFPKKAIGSDSHSRFAPASTSTDKARRSSRGGGTGPPGDVVTSSKPDDDEDAPFVVASFVQRPAFSRAHCQQRAKRGVSSSPA
mmetsp:Transcript_29798/g.91237  ORF Transcript_29798/g.91237 Transcript_29798/m.91237 type:complete len:204 (+) Transcript_29798:130-741(+)